MPQLETALEHARSKKDEHLSEYKEILAIPSISTLPEHKPDMVRCADWFAAQLRSLGLHGVEIMETPGHPVVYGEWAEARGKPTVLVYGHYDVQPVDPVDEWESGPFEGAVRGDYIYARGASDMKGQIFAHIKAMESLVAAGPLPVNVKYLIEGEEEIGSPNLDAFIDANMERLQCDFVLNCDTGIHGPEDPAIVYSLRGLAYFELKLRAHKKDLHSGLFGGSVYNPLHVLCELIAGMHDGTGRVTLPGFYDSVRALSDEERGALSKLPYSEAAWLDMAGAKAVYGEEGYTTIERVGARPTLEINGIWGGFIGEGSKTVLPAVATAKISMRLVADQKPGDMHGQLCAYLKEHVPEAVAWEVRELAHGPGSIMDRHSPAMKSAVASLKTVFGKEPFFKREGGSVPVVGMMQDKLGVDSVMLGFALPDDGIHGPNERQYLPNFFRGIETYIHFMSTI